MAMDPQPVELAGSNVKLLDAATESGTGMPKLVSGNKEYVFEVSGTATSFTLRIEAVGPSGTAFTKKIWDEVNETFIGTDITAKGLYSVSVPKMMGIRANLIAVTGGNITVDGGLGQ
ncbi:hypothetical protein [Gorillibacterium sp. sgz5001074]|uniref:hypothetical protein n=1 Tax=Gorillibacterium sp. sgz5001074 TaxID=3446695 RepID=UPI003F66ECBD